MYDVITFGEPMIRFQPSTQHERLEQTHLFSSTLGGAEINVCAALANIGKLKTAIITKLPTNALGKWVEHELDYYKVGTEFVVHGGKRVGKYFTEQGSRPRTAYVEYDRENSSFAESTFSDYDLNYSEKAKIFHTTGITLALNQNTRNAAIEMIKSFKGTDTLVSFDVNYRANLWSEAEAKETIEQILPYVDILFISETTCRKMFQRKGSLEEILKEFADTYDISIIASTKREVISQTQHKFSSVIYERNTDKIYSTVKPYEVEVVDRVGSGDAYIAGVLYGLLSSFWSCEKAQKYGDAFSVLKCTILGDILVSSQGEVEAIIQKHAEGIVEDINC